MFNQNNDEVKLDWMYKGPHSTVNREEYLLGRSVDKTLEQINEEERLKQQGLTAAPPKNRVEHECIPPSIRDFNKVVQAEQVDLSTKLQEDPLVAIKKREEETVRQFLQNPVQLKKLQKALKAQQTQKTKEKKKKKKKKKHSSKDLDAKLTEKLLGREQSKKLSKDERNLDTILIHKYGAFKDLLTEDDMRDILAGKLTDSEDDDAEEKSVKKSKKSKGKYKEESEDSSPDGNYKSRSHRDKVDNSHKNKKPYSAKRYEGETSNSKNRSKSSSDDGSSSSEEDSDDSSKNHSKKKRFGLVSASGKKIALKKNKEPEPSLKPKPSKTPEPVKSTSTKPHNKKLSEEEKDKLRQEMMRNAVDRDKERTRYVKKYRENEAKEHRNQTYDPEFTHKQLVKAAHTSSVESRIKSNLNNIQRSSRDMNTHFSRH